MGIVARFPRSWRTSVTVVRGGGRDHMGNPVPASEVVLADCVVGPRSSGEPMVQGDVVSSELSVYRDPDPAFRFLSTDKIIVPEGALNAGTYEVDGRPHEFPLGVEVRIREGA